MMCQNDSTYQAFTHQMQVFSVNSQKHVFQPADWASLNIFNQNI